MKRVVLIANTGWYLFNFRRNLCFFLRDCGYEVVLLAPEDQYLRRLGGEGFEFRPFEMTPRGTNPIIEMSLVIRLQNTLKTLRPDAVLTFTPKCNLYTGLRFRKRAFVHLPNISGLGEARGRHGPVSWASHMLYLSLGRSGSRLFFQNQEDMDLLVKAGMVKRDCAVRLPGSGVDLAHFVPVARPEERAPLRLAMLGRIIEEKGYRLILDLFEQFSDVSSKVEISILGIPDPSRSASMSLYRRLKDVSQVGKGISIFEPTDDVRPFLNRADAVLLPSTYHEGVPRSLIEGLACGLPILTTDWKGCRDVVEHGVNGLLFAPNNLAAMREALERFFDLSPSERQRWGQASRLKAEREFDEKIVLRRYAEALNDLL